VEETVQSESNVPSDYILRMHRNVHLYTLLFCSRNTMSQLFTVETEINRQYRLFNAEGTQINVRLSAPTEGDAYPITYSLNSMTELF
jgi:hypothetical protein